MGLGARHGEADVLDAEEARSLTLNLSLSLTLSLSLSPSLTLSLSVSLSLTLSLALALPLPLPLAPTFMQTMLERFIARSIGKGSCVHTWPGRYRGDIGEI